MAAGRSSSPSSYCAYAPSPAALVVAPPAAIISAERIAMAEEQGASRGEIAK